MNNEINGFVNILKPTGLTSSDVVLKIKKIFNMKKVGHLGTLDPNASGVLPIALGRGTKFFDYFLTKNKRYFATVKFGVETDSLDSSGKIINQNNFKLNKQILEETVKKFVGKISQIPPKYSAIKIDGQKACDLARKNIDFEIKPRNIEIFDIKIQNVDEINNLASFVVDCEAGTYIRTLFSDIAKEMGTYSYTPIIIRQKSGRFELSSSTTLEELEQSKKFLTINEVFSDLKNISVEKNTAEKLINGVKLTINDIKETNGLNQPFFLSFEGKTIGFYEIIDDIKIHLIVYLYL